MKVIFLIIATLFFCSVQGQNDRVKDENAIAWPQLNVTIKLHNKLDLLAEYQWRRTNGFKDWQQSLLRGAVQYKLHPQMAVALGYGWIETFAYGDHPIASNGTFPEHRIYEQVTYKSNIQKLSFQQRLRIEQRWIGRRTTSSAREIDDWLFSHRFRYLLRLQHSLGRSQKWYAAMADEIFIGAGKNVGVNIFDQNRIMLLIGVKPTSNISIEAGYLSQMLVQGRRINEKTVVQDNKGLIIAAYFNL